MATGDASGEVAQRTFREDGINRFFDQPYIVAYSVGSCSEIDLGEETWEPCAYIDGAGAKPVHHRASLVVHVIKTESEHEQWVILGIKKCYWPKGALKDIVEILGVCDGKPLREDVKKAIEKSVFVKSETKANLDKLLEDHTGFGFAKG